MIGLMAQKTAVAYVAEFPANEVDRRAHPHAQTGERERASEREMEMEASSSSLATIPSTLRHRLLEFLLHASSVKAPFQFMPSFATTRKPSLVFPLWSLISVPSFSKKKKKQLQCPPIVKYTALSFFADRFLPSLCRYHLRPRKFSSKDRL